MRKRIGTKLYDTETSQKLGTCGEFSMYRNKKGTYFTASQCEIIPISYQEAVSMAENYNCVNFFHSRELEETNRQIKTVVPNDYRVKLQNMADSQGRDLSSLISQILVDWVDAQPNTIVPPRKPEGKDG